MKMTLTYRERHLHVHNNNYKNPYDSYELHQENVEYEGPPNILYNGELNSWKLVNDKLVVYELDVGVQG